MVRPLRWMRCTKNAWNKFPYPHSRFNFPPSKKNPETSSTAKWFGGKLGGSQIRTWIWPSYNYEQNTQVQGKGLFKNMAFTHVTSTRTTTHTVLQLEGQNSVCCSLRGCHGITKGHIYCLRDFSLIFSREWVMALGTSIIDYRLYVIYYSSALPRSILVPSSSRSFTLKSVNPADTILLGFAPRHTSRNQ